eukprot:14706299-Alexandrium_andersonii.AAC.1
MSASLVGSEMCIRDSRASALAAHSSFRVPDGSGWAPRQHAECLADRETCWCLRFTSTPPERHGGA